MAVISSIGLCQDLDGFEIVMPRREEDFAVLRALDGSPRIQDWRPIEVEIVCSDRGRPLRAADVPLLTANTLALTARALEVMGPVLTRWGEILPLECRDRELYAYNVTTVVDALDEVASSIVRFADGRVMTIARHVFVPDALGDVEVFRLPQYRVSPIYATSSFQDFVGSSGLTGLAFREVWSVAGD